MRVAALYDIHGNLPALEAVLADVAKIGVDRIVVGGDVLPGPMPREALERLLTLDVAVDFVYGNGEVAVLDAAAGRPSNVPETYQPLINWNAEQVLGYESMLGSWPMAISLDISGIGRVLFCHATPRSEDEIFTVVTPDERLLPAFADVDASLVVCGHTHSQFDRRVGRTQVVNAGSVGLAFGTAGHADWLLLGSTVEFRATSYDHTRAASIIAETLCPLAREFFAQNILHPPSAAEMLAAYEATA
jgi:predicted phosphodiesterase